MRQSIMMAKRCRQIENYELNISVDGTIATPVADGMDKNQVLSVVDNGTGDYTINFKEKSPLDIVVIGIVPKTAGVIPSVVATDQQSVNVAFTDIAGDPADASFNLCVNWLGSKHLF